MTGCAHRSWKSVVVLVVAAACGGGGGSSDNADASGSDNADASGVSDAGSDGSASGCEAEGSACRMEDGAAGLCAGSACGTCVGVDDDAACEAAYGSGTLCVQGECLEAECHTGAQCGGQRCVDHECVGCAGDGGCDADEVCDTGSGVCASAANACEGMAISDSCGPGGAGLCCTRQAGLRCVDVECCDATDCGGDGATCEGGVCVPAESSCVAPATPTYFVNPGYIGVTTGTQACPFRTLHSAFNAIRTDDFDEASEVRIVGSANINSITEGGEDQFPLAVPAWTAVHTAIGLPNAVITVPAGRTGFETLYGVDPEDDTIDFSVRIHHLEIKQASGGGTDGTGIEVMAGNASHPIQIDHVEIHGFKNGIRVTEGGRAELNWGVYVHDNTSAGLRIAGGRADISVSAAADANTEFSGNKDGIVVTSDESSILVASGSENDEGLKRIKVRANNDAGIRIYNSNDTNSLDHVGIDSNGTSGLAVYANTHVKVRNSNIANSAGSGVRVNTNGDHTGIAGIDLGEYPDPGLNDLHDNGSADLCIELVGPSNDLMAEGNFWSGIDCTTAGMVPATGVCSGAGAGVAWQSAGFDNIVAPISVAKCELKYPE